MSTTQTINHTKQHERKNNNNDVSFNNTITSSHNNTTSHSHNETITQISPASFPFPYTPYSIQNDLMCQIFDTLEKGNGAVTIVESPTGKINKINNTDQLHKKH